MNKKDYTLAAIVGTVIGAILGYFMALTLLGKAEECSETAKENKMLKEMILDCEEAK